MTRHPMGAAFCLAIGLTIGVAAPLHADFDADSYPAYETCALCHGLSGQSRLDRFPHLAGQNPAYIQAQLTAFLSGVRRNDGGQMSSIVTELAPEDLPVVIEWFAQQDPPPASDPPDSDLGQTLTEAAGCLGCHEVDSDGAVPYLSAQHAGYLSKQMRDFRDGRRDHGAFAEMHQEIFSGMDTGIDEIAAYLASLERPE